MGQRKAKKRSDSVTVGVGPPCPRCHTPTVRLEHGASWTPAPNRWSLRYWWRCLNSNCRTKQINPTERDAWSWSGPQPEPPFAQGAASISARDDASDIDSLFRHMASTAYGVPTDGRPPWEE